MTLVSSIYSFLRSTFNLAIISNSLRIDQKIARSSENYRIPFRFNEITKNASSGKLIEIMINVRARGAISREKQREREINCKNSSAIPSASMVVLTRSRCVGRQGRGNIRVKYKCRRFVEREDRKEITRKRREESRLRVFSAAAETKPFERDWKGNKCLAIDVYKGVGLFCNPLIACLCILIVSLTAIYLRFSTYVCQKSRIFHFRGQLNFFSPLKLILYDACEIVT